MHGLSYQMAAGDDRVWVHEDMILIGWMIDGQFKSVIDQTETDAMLDAALRNKPKATDQEPPR